MASDLLRSNTFWFLLLFTVAFADLTRGADTMSIGVMTDGTSQSVGKKAPYKTLSGVPYLAGSDGGNTPIRRIEYVSVTVDNLERVVPFYTNVLGYDEVEFCRGAHSTSNSCGSDGEVILTGPKVHAALFAPDLIHGEVVPNLADGTWEAGSRFFVLGNSVLQLLEFRMSDSPHIKWDSFEPMTSPVWMAKAHIDFWVENGVDTNYYVESVERQAESMGLEDVAFNRPVVQEKREDRSKVPVDKYTNKVVGSSFDGLAWAYWKGPSAEQLEIYQIDRTMRLGVGRAYCKRGAVSPAFVNPQARSKYNITQETGELSRRNHGLFQWGYRTADLHAAAGFYSEVLGGDLITYPTQGIQIMQDDSAHWMILANETIEAYELSGRSGRPREEAMRQLGVPNISASGYNRLDHRFILFDNFVVEPLKYTDGLSFGGDGFNPRLNHTSSPSYIGAISAAFSLKTNEDPTESIHELKSRARQRGFHRAVFPEEGDFHSFDETHPYNGLGLAYGKGPDGESILFSKIDPEGAFGLKLKQALMSHGGLSTAFKETDPFANGDMNEFCAYATSTPLYSAYEP